MMARGTYSPYSGGTSVMVLSLELFVHCGYNGHGQLFKSSVFQNCSASCALTPCCLCVCIPAVTVFDLLLQYNCSAGPSKSRYNPIRHSVELEEENVFVVEKIYAA